MRLDGHFLSGPQQWLGYFLLLALGILAQSLPGAEQYEGKWRDIGFRWLTPSTHDPVVDSVVIVGIDDEDLKQFGVPVAMLHRELGAFLESMAVARPRAVGLDVLLPSTSFDKVQPGLDAALARGIVAVRTATVLVLGMGAFDDGRPRPLHAPFAALAGKERVGFVFLLPDGDGVVRRFDERLGSQGEPVPTLVGQMARQLGLKPTAGIINYAQGTPFSYIPLREVLAWRETAQIERLQGEFGGKAVLLGSVLAFDDQHRAPIPLSSWIDASSTSHGVLLHAQQLRNVLSNSLINPLPLVAQGLVLALLALSWFLRPGILSWFVGLGSLLAILVGSILLLGKGMAVPAMSWSATLLLGVSARAGCHGVLATQERRRLRESFGGFVSPAVLEEILSGRLDPKMAGSRRDICVLFSDIRGFTTLSESLQPEKVTDLLNRYFDLMAAAIHRHHGTLDKFIGDGIMAVFGAPKDLPESCNDAMAAAKSMIASVATFNEQQVRRGDPTIRIGVGLHFGPAFIGYVGSKDRFEYSAIGDTVNAAARIEGMTKDMGCVLLLSAEVFHRLGDRANLRSVGAVEIRGRSSMELYGWTPPNESAP